MKITPIEESSSVSIGIALALCGFVWGLAHMDSKVTDIAEDVAELKLAQVQNIEFHHEIKSDMSLIKYQLGRVVVTMKKKAAKDVAMRAGAPMQCSTLFKPIPIVTMDD